MPLNVDRTSISLSQAARHQHALELPDRAARVATAQDESTEAGDVKLDVRLTRGTFEDVRNLNRAEQLVKSLRGDSIAALRGLHAGLDPNRAAALLAD